MRKTYLKTIIALALSSSAIAAEPFSFEGTWYYDRYNPINDGLLQITNCRYAFCDIELRTLWGKKQCTFSGEMELITNEKAQIIKTLPAPSQTFCQIDLTHSGNGQITITSKNCETLCDKGADFNGIYENAVFSPAYPTDIDCRDERITYAEATICQNKTLSLAEQEIKKLSQNNILSEKAITEWTYQRNLCKTDVHCLNRKYIEYIYALLQNKIGEEASLEEYYHVTQTGYASPFESYLIRVMLENKISPEQIKSLEKQAAIRHDYSDENKIFLTYSPLDEETHELICFYLQKNNLWLGFPDKDKNGASQITLYAPQGKTKRNIPQEIQTWKQKLPPINGQSAKDIKLNLKPIL